MVSGGDVAFCPACEQEQKIMKTVAWQQDICRTCGNNVPSPHNETLTEETLSRVEDTETHYCSYCKTERATISTVAWQSDLCQICHNELNSSTATNQTPQRTAPTGMSEKASTPADSD